MAPLPDRMDADVTAPDDVLTAPDDVLNALVDADPDSYVPDAPAATCDDVPPECHSTFQCAGSTSCYVRCRTETDWASAEQSCEAWGGTLVTLDTIEENACVGAQILIATAWIGLREQTPGTWTWISGSSASFRNWHPGQPDDTDVDGKMVNVACTRLNNDGGQMWYDEDCAFEFDYVCER